MLGNDDCVVALGKHDNLRNLFLRKHKSARRIFVY